MKRFIFAASICLLCVCFAAQIQAQTPHKWYVAPFARATAVSGEGVGSAGFAVGHYVGKGNDWRIDLEATYMFVEGDMNWGMVSALSTFESPDNLFNCSRIYTTTAVGIGVLSSLYSNRDGGVRSFSDIVLPLKCGVEYRFSDAFCIGTELDYTVNLSNFKKRSMFSVGLRLGFRF